MWWQYGEGEAAPQKGRRILCQLALIILPLGCPFMVVFALLGHPKQNISLGSWRWGREFTIMRAPPVRLFNSLAMNGARNFFSFPSFKAKCNPSSYTKKSGLQPMVNFPISWVWKPLRISATGKGQTFLKFPKGEASFKIALSTWEVFSAPGSFLFAGWWEAHATQKWVWRWYCLWSMEEYQGWKSWIHNPC